MDHVRYIDKTREYYLAEGYEKPYHWAHFDEVPFTPLIKPLAESRIALASTSDVAVRPENDDEDPTHSLLVGNVYSIPSDTPLVEGRAMRLPASQSPLLAMSGHAEGCARTSALPPKADIRDCFAYSAQHISN